jgi:glyoxylase-like metal-dependent hydrolase (beta-lactamase superfamily II)
MLRALLREKVEVAHLADDTLVDRVIGNVTVLYGAGHGKYPHGNSLVVRGARETLMIDASLGVVARKARLPRVDRLWNSHCHEDHIAGNHLFPGVPWELHEADLLGMHSFAGFLQIYGYDDAVLGGGWEKALKEQFFYTANPRATGFRDGHVLELGGGVRVRVIHTPGHTRGHCAFHVEPDDLLYVGDIDLSSFGPYYGDAWSELEDFERSLRLVRAVQAKHYATFHHIGVVDRDTFVSRLDKFSAVIASREERLLSYLAEAPRTLDEITKHRFVYRPTDPVSFADPVERRSMSQHLARLVASGRAREISPGRFEARVV